MTTTDPGRHHRQVAEQSLADAGKFVPEDLVRATFIAEAQVHATLALVEEQRTANLIAAAPSFNFDYPEDLVVRLAGRLGVE